MSNEDGFTLIEMVITALLMTVIVGTVGGGLVIMFSTTEETTQRLSESPDLQIAAAYFGGDVQSATTVETTTFSTACGFLAAGATRVLNLSWVDPGGDPKSGDETPRIATYVLEPATNQKKLVRYYCDGSGSGESATLVNFVAPTTAPTAACAPVGCAPGTTVSLPITICTADATGTCRYDSLPFELKAKRRATT